MKEYIKLLRMKHYIKNLLVFVPLFFSGMFFDVYRLRNTMIGFIDFCLVSSAVYILNDYRDIEKDRKHPTKKNRPLASGKISVKTAMGIMVVCLAAAVGICVWLGNINAMICLTLYFLLNIGYSMGLKNKPIIDVIILASGFSLRVFFVGFVADITISKWLYLVVTTGSLYMGLGKRRNELRKQHETREVLKYYTLSFLDNNMYVCVALTNVFYALWTVEMRDTRMSWTVLVFIVILMRYSLDTESDSDGDPVEVILKDRGLILISVIYACCIFAMLYIL